MYLMDHKGPNCPSVQLQKGKKGGNGFQLLCIWVFFVSIMINVVNQEM